MNENQTSAPPLDVDLNTVDTSMPLLKKAILDLRVQEAGIKATTDGKGKFIKLDMVTTSPAPSVKDDTLGAGVHVFDNVNIIPTGKATWDIVLQNLASLTQAAGLGSIKFNKSEGPAGWERVTTQLAAQLNGRTLRVSVGVKPEGSRMVNGIQKSFRASNEVLAYIKK